MPREFHILAFSVATLLSAQGASAAGPNYPFGARLDKYIASLARTSSVQGNATQDQAIRQLYDRWKSARLYPVDAWGIAGGKVILNPYTYAPTSGIIPNFAFSEGIGYGMLLSVLMAGHDANAKASFDGLYAVARARFASGMAGTSATCNANAAKYLMGWTLDNKGSLGANGIWNAVDGDLDIAMALLMADRQWGSAASGLGAYKSNAVATINAIKACNMGADGTVIAQWRPNQAVQAISRTSDYMMGHFRAFAKVTGDPFWTTTLNRSAKLLTMFQSPTTGLVPEAIYNSLTQPVAGNAGLMDGYADARDGKFGYNAVRVPWRLAADYAFTGDTRWETTLRRMSKFFYRQGTCVQGGPTTDIYNLDGSAYSIPGFEPRPMIAGALGASVATPDPVDPNFNATIAQAAYDRCWTREINVFQNLTIPPYYEGELSLLSQIIASGNWWNPTAAATAAVPQISAVTVTPSPMVVGKPLTLSVTVTGSPTSYTYSLFRDVPNGAGWQVIVSNQTGPSVSVYTPTPSDVGAGLAWQIVAKNAAGASALHQGTTGWTNVVRAK